MKCIGLDITANGATIIEMSADRNGYEILRGDYVSVDPNDPSNWEIDLLQGLKRFTEEFDFVNSSVVVGINQNTTSTRNLNFPFTRRLDILRNLPFELDEELPMSAEDAYFDAKTVSLSPGSTSILAFASPKNEVRRVLDLLEKVGIDPDIIGAEGSAFANLFEDWHNGSFLVSPPETIPSPMHMRIFFRHDTTLISLFHDRQMVWTRSVSWGERNIILELMKHYNYPYEQAASLVPDNIRLLLVAAGASAADVKLSGIVEHSLNEFIRQLKLSIIDVQDKFSGGIGSISLLGSLSFVENINAHLTSSTGIPCNLENLSVDVFQPRQVEPVAHFINRAAIAIGLALEGLKRPRNPAVNLRQGESAKRNLFWEKTWQKWGSAMVLGAVAYVCFIVYGVIRENIATTLDDVTYQELQKSAGTIAGLRGSLATPDKIERYLNNEELKAKNAKLFEKVHDIEPAIKIVSALSTGLPESDKNGYDIRRVDVKNFSVIIEGEAKQRATVDLLRKRLEGMSANKKVQTVPTTFGTGKGVPFAFKFTARETL